MGVIHVLTPEYLPKIGGVADYTRQVAQALAEAGEEVHVWCPATGEGAAADRFTVHAELGRFEPAELARAGRLLDRFSSPRRLLVQWVPHGYGRRAMNIPFCFWLWRRAAAGDQIELMVHEPYLHLWEGSWRQTAAAVVHRFMTAVLLRAATRVWISVPAWERMWKPYTFGRSVPFTWLPIPSGVSQPDALEVRELRARLGADRHAVIGHLGTYNSLVSALLDGLLPRMLRQLSEPHVLLIGTGSEQYRAAFLMRHPQYADRIGATGPLSARALATHIAACDLLVQPYPDGITSRRTTAMAGLRLGVPIVTTSGYLTERLWEETGAVRLSEVADQAGTVAHVADLLARADVRTRLGETGRDVYARMFDISRTVSALTGAAPGRAA